MWRVLKMSNTHIIYYNQNNLILENYCTFGETKPKIIYFTNFIYNLSYIYIYFIQWKSWDNWELFNIIYEYIKTKLITLYFFMF